MRPGSIGSPSFGLHAGSGPARVSSVGRTLFTPGARCHTTNSDAGSPRGRRATSCSSAPIPPAEAPTTTMSFFAIRAALQLSRPSRNQGQTTFISHSSPGDEQAHLTRRGLALQRASGFAALDPAAKNGGELALEALITEHEVSVRRCADFIRRPVAGIAAEQVLIGAAAALAGDPESYI